MDEIAMLERVGNLANSLEIAGRRIAELEAKLEAHERNYECYAAEIHDLQSKLQAYQKLCPSVQDLETGEQLHPESTISVGLGRYRQLLDDADRLADKLNDIRHAWEHAEEIGRMDTYAANTIKEALKL